MICTSLAPPKSDVSSCAHDYIMFLGVEEKIKFTKIIRITNKHKTMLTIITYLFFDVTAVIIIIICSITFFGCYFYPYFLLPHKYTAKLIHEENNIKIYNFMHNVYTYVHKYVYKYIAVDIACASRHCRRAAR